jgi:hypothetical protein
MGQLSERASEMQKLVDIFCRSGQTRREFCAKRGIPVTTFDYWRLRLRSAGPGQPRLVKVEVARAQAPNFTLRLANGRAIESSFGFAEEELARLIRVAERA